MTDKHWWTLGVHGYHGYGQFGFYGTDKEAESIRAHKSQLEQAVTTKRRASINEEQQYITATSPTVIAYMEDLDGFTDSIAKTIDRTREILHRYGATP